MEVDRKVLLQLAKREPFRLRDASELRPLNGRGGQRSRGKRLFQSVPAKGAQCPQQPVKGLLQLRKRVGQSGGRCRRRPRLPISFASEAQMSPNRRIAVTSASLRRHSIKKMFSTSALPGKLEHFFNHNLGS